jgi:hypothetical protein
MAIKVTVKGFDALQRALEDMVNAVADDQNMEESLVPILEEVKAASQEIVPYETGELHDSAFVQVERRGDTIIGRVAYAAPHALLVHELPDLEHAPGKSWKFLEQPFVERQPEMIERIGRQVGERIKREIK